MGWYQRRVHGVESGWETSWLNGFAICVLLLFLYTAHMLYTLASRIALAASMIQAAGGILQECPSIFFVHSVFAISKFFWALFCGAAGWAIIGNTEHHTFWVATGLVLMT